jgi:N-acetylmuramoyl-L-alanine amidase
MNRPYLKNLTKSLILFLTLAFFTTNAQAQIPVKKLNKVCIDAGHGGKDPGCHGGYSSEKDITLAVTLKLRELIQKNIKDLKVVLTRDTDIFWELEERGQIANSSRADLFISIHVNSTPKKIGTSNGTETFVLGLTRDSDKKGAISDKGEFDSGEGQSQMMNDSDPMTQIIIASHVQAYLSTSIILGDKIESEFVNQGRLSKGVKQKSLGVLAHSGMPGVLIEIGFLNNPDEEAYLNSEQGILDVATAIFNGIKAFKVDYEKGFSTGN